MVIKDAEYYREWRRRNPSKAMEYTNRYKAKRLATDPDDYREKIRVRARVYVAKRIAIDPEGFLAMKRLAAKKYKKAHPDRRLESNNRWKAKNPELVKAAKLRWSFKNPGINNLYVTRSASKRRIRSAQAEMMAAGMGFVQDMQHA